MNTAAAARTHRRFGPYRQSAEFRRVYQHDPSARRLSNTFFMQNAYTHPLVTGGREDLRPEVLRNLDRNYLFSIHGKPSYLFIQHSFAAYAIAEAVAFGRMRKGSTFVHFDAHPDMESNLTPQDSLRTIFTSMLGQISDMSFIWPMVELDYIKEIYWFRSPAGFTFVNGTTRQICKSFPHLKLTEVRPEEIADFDRRSLRGIPADQLILGIDYDYFAHLDSSYFSSISKLIRYVFHRSNLLVQALSCPDYIDTDLAARTAVDTMRNL